ncbi:MAG: hypothetical protein BWY69_00976 [Planctomycetes bacterium ADurb.Bin401]|nr:MAG: hypothetical protein BWY69_00976 [Planctomycetes bacterium ADurb.Bin401]
MLKALNNFSVYILKFRRFFLNHIHGKYDMPQKLAAVRITERHTISQFFGLSHIVQKYPRQNKVLLKLRVQRHNCLGRVKHIIGMFQKSADITVMIRSPARRCAELFHHLFIIHKLIYKRLQKRIFDFRNDLYSIVPHLFYIFFRPRQIIVNIDLLRRNSRNTISNNLHSILI